MAEIYKIGSDDLIDRVSTFGGTNLILNSAGEWTNTATTAAWKRYNTTVVPLEKNVVYTISFDVKTSNGTDVFYAGLALTDSTKVYVGSIQPTTEYSRMSVTMTNTSSDNLNAVIVSNAKTYGRGNDNNSGTIWIKNVKLEKGNKPTDWTPAPHDLVTYDSSSESLVFFQ